MRRARASRVSTVVTGRESRSAISFWLNPWTLRKKLWKRAEEDYVLFEYACHEGNVGWENIKKGLIGKPPAP